MAVGAATRRTRADDLGYWKWSGFGIQPRSDVISGKDKVAMVLLDDEVVGDPRLPQRFPPGAQRPAERTVGQAAEGHASGAMEQDERI